MSQPATTEQLESLGPLLSVFGLTCAGIAALILICCLGSLQ